MTADNKPPNADVTQVQGEGDYASDRKYTKSVQSFVASGKVEKAARDAKPGSAEDATEMHRAEVAAESHSKGEDPASRRAPPRRP